MLLLRDVDYIVRDGRIEIVDELTGRVVQDRHWPDGLQAALEAKEGLARRADGAHPGLHHPSALPARLPAPVRHDGHRAGRGAQSCTSSTACAWSSSPPTAPCVRLDHPDVVFTHREAKERRAGGGGRAASTPRGGRSWWAR